MKKLIRILSIVLVLLSVTTVCAAASEEPTAALEYEIGDTEYTVAFYDNTLTSEEQNEIAQKLLGIHSDSGIETAGLLCDLFGHSFGNAKTVSVTEHKVRATSPRCLITYFEVTTCSACGEQNQETISSSYIYCCS